MTPKYIAYLNSPKWAEIRNDLYAIRGRICERCGSKNNIHIHHKTYKNIFHEEPKDLEILCQGCHRAEHGIVKTRTGKYKKKRVISLAEKVAMKKRKKKGMSYKWLKKHKKLK